MLSDSNLLTFKAIISFVNDLNSLFGSVQHSLKLYHHLITKTTFAHDKPILKHIEAFTQYCSSNIDAIMNKDKNRLNNDNIQYSERVYINLRALFFSQKKVIDSETEEAIWKHLIYINARTNPNEGAIRLLKSVMESKSNSERKEGSIPVNIPGEGKEKEFLTNIMNKVENCIDPNTTNPLQAISSIMSSGLLTELVSDMGKGIENGSINLNSLMGTLQSMVSTMGGPQTGGGNTPNPLASGGFDINSITNMMQTMMSNGGTGGTNSGEMPDLSGLLGTLMGSMGSGNPTETIQKSNTRMRGPPKIQDDLE